MVKILFLFLGNCIRKYGMFGYFLGCIFVLNLYMGDFFLSFILVIVSFIKLNDYSFLFILKGDLICYLKCKINCFSIFNRLNKGESN